MPQNFLTCDRDQSLLLPPDLRDWLPDDHLAWFVIEFGQSSPGRSAMLSSEPCPVDSTRPRLSFIDISGMRSLRSTV
jgi:hypothetical protein